MCKRDLHFPIHNTHVRYVLLILISNKQKKPKQWRMIHLKSYMPGSMYRVNQHVFLFLLSFISLFKIDNLDDERSWIRKYIEFDRTKRTLTFYSNDVCIFFRYFYKHWMNEWVHQLTSSIQSTFPQLFSTVMYVHQLMSIFHPCAMPHIIASSSLHMRMCVGDTHTHINRMFVRMYWMMEPFFLSSSPSSCIDLYICNAGMSTKWWIELINKRKRKKKKMMA